MRVPGECPYELRTIRVGKLKTCCSLKGGEIWTECREWGRCNWDGYEEPSESETERDDNEPERIEANVSESEQMRLFE